MIDDCMYFYGGRTKRRQRTGSLYRLNLSDWMWQEMSPPGASGSPGVRYGIRMIDYEHSLLIHGGFNERGRRTSDLHMFDIATGEFKLSWNMLIGDIC